MSVLAQNNLETKNGNLENNENSGDEDERLVGIIIPPPELRHIIETTATFVAKNGKSFEERIKKDNPDKKKFDFLQNESPYNAYYQNKIKETIKKLENPESQPMQKLSNEIKEMTTGAELEENASKPPMQHLANSELIKNIDLEFLIDPPTLKAEDIMILKLTAQYAAINGRKFLIDLSEREFKNPKFDFLKPQHSYFAYFTKLIEQYVKIIVPNSITLDDLKKDFSQQSNVLKKIQSRVSWMHFNAKQRATIKEVDEKDRIAYSQIDWNEFTIVETIDYREGDEGVFLPPCQPNQIGMRIMMQERLISDSKLPEKTNEVKKETTKISTKVPKNETMESKLSSNQQIGPNLSEIKNIPTEVSDSKETIFKEKVIEANYDPKSKSSHNTHPSQSLVSPFTGESIPTVNVHQHLKYILESNKNKPTHSESYESAYAGGDEIARNLKKLHDERLDIFQVGVDEGKGKPVEFKNPSHQSFVNWENTNNINNHENIHPTGSSIIPPPIINPFPNQPMAPPSIPSSNDQVSHQKNNFSEVNSTSTSNNMPAPISYPDPSIGINNYIPPPVPTPPSVLFAQPEVKKFKGDRNILSEIDFLNQYGSDPLPFFIALPNLPNNNDWDLKGQTLQIVFSLDQPVSKLKSEIFNLTKFPVSKQKLQFENIFFKENDTLALHNVNPRSIINVSIKERGGKRK